MLRKLEGRRYLTYSEARQIMEARIAEANGALNPTQERTWQYLKTFGTADPTLARNAVDELVKEGIDEYLAVQLVNLCPDDDGFVRLILSSKENLEVTDELLGKIRATLSKVCQGAASSSQA